MCQPQGARIDPQSLEHGLGLIRAILAGQAGDGLSPLPPVGHGDAGMQPAPPAAAVHPANGGGGLLQPAGTAPSPALGLSFLAPGVPAQDPGNTAPQPDPPGPQAGPGHPGLPVSTTPPAGGISICLHLSPETVAALMGAVMHLLGGGAQEPANPAPPHQHEGVGSAPPKPEAAAERPGRCPGADRAAGGGGPVIGATGPGAPPR